MTNQNLELNFVKNTFLDNLDYNTNCNLRNADKSLIMFPSDKEALNKQE